MVTEGPVNTEQQWNIVSRFKQFLANIVDVGLCYLILSLILIYQIPARLYQWLEPFNATIVLLVFYLLYRLTCFLVFQRTIGMKLFRIALLNREMQKLSIIERLLASFFILFRGVEYYNR